jgi:hypothetical protein
VRLGLAAVARPGRGGAHARLPADGGTARLRRLVGGRPWRAQCEGGRGAAWVTNWGAVDSPLVSVRASLNAVLVGESHPDLVEGYGGEDFEVRPVASADWPYRPYPHSGLTLAVIGGPGGDVLAS